jgi:anti-sigma regulatory factor (Ser/Thr protein kinase)
VTRVGCPDTNAQDSQAPISMRIQGGAGAPSKARRSVLSQVGFQLDPGRASDLGLIVSELVTNSVRHANVGSEQTLTIELTKLEDRLRLAIIDHGSALEPSLRPREEDKAGGFGLFLVDRVSASWGVSHGPAGTTRVWCELALS